MVRPRLRAALGHRDAWLDSTVWQCGGRTPLLQVRGWCESREGAPAEVELWADGVLLGRGVCDQRRPDVAHSLGVDVGTPLGFEVLVRVARPVLTTSAMTLELRLAGGRRLVHADVEAAPLPPEVEGVSFGIDHPLDQAVITSPILAVSGWVLAAGGTARVDVEVAEHGVVQAFLGLPRQDVHENFRAWPDVGGCGFSAAIDLTGSAAGQTTLRVTMADGSGAQHLLAERMVTIQPVTVPAATRVARAGAPSLRSVSAPPRLLLVLPDGRHGGAQLRALDLVPALTAAFAVTVATPQDGPLLAAFRTAGAMVELLAPDVTDDPTSGLERLHGIAPYDVVLAETLLCDWAVRWAAAAGVPSVFEVHESQPVPEFLYGSRGGDDGLAEAVARCWDALSSATEVVVAQSGLAAQLGRGAGRSARIVPTGIDLADWQRRVAQHTRSGRRGRSVGPLRVLCVGSGAPHKGQAVLLRALLMTEPGTVAASFVGVGDNSYVDALREDLWRGGLREVSVLSRAPDPAEQFAQADVLVCPSYTETFPGVVLEARAAGLHIVASDLPGTRAAVGAHPVTWVPAGDAASLANALRNLAEQPPQRTPGRDVPDADTRARKLLQILQDSLTPVA